ncbi:MAG: diguanylate cyclase [Psychrobium sp.]|nr:diguanylate cyclase [Psychrobium sp.]
MLKNNKIFKPKIQQGITVTLLAISLAVTVAFFYLERLSKQQIQKFAIENAKMYISTLTKVRSLYTSEVVNTAKANGLKITHDYQNHDNAIPLPATFSMLLGNNLNIPGVRSRLYSPFPFPWRVKNIGTQDQFGEQAWQALNKNPTQDYYKFEQVNGVQSLRYASADVMRQSCLNCHNNHPQTPFNQWKLGDVRGVLEVILPVDKTTKEFSRLLKETFIGLLGICLATSIAIIIIVNRLKYKLQRAQRSSSKAAVLNGELQQKIKSGKLVQQHLLDISLTDALTGIANRRCFDQELAKQWQCSLLQRKTLAVILIDIDHFKNYNDNYGHVKGDEALHLVAQCMQGSLLRPSDIIYRYGGEEFVLILTGVDQRGAQKVAQRILYNIEQLAIEHNFSSVSSLLTVSAGIAVTLPTPKNIATELVIQSDEALYLAKNSGRNCIRTAHNTI